MNCFLYSQIPIGYYEEFETSITEEKQKLFCELTGDTNPLHMDSSYAASKGFSDRVVYGMLVSSYYSKLVGVYIPGETCLLLNMDVKYKSPVYIGDYLIVSGTVAEKLDVYHILVIHASIKKKDNEQIVSKAKIKVQVLG